MNSPVESFIPGRIRLRSSLIKDPAARELLRTAFSLLPGLKTATPNERTGSLLLIYDPAALPAERLMALLPHLEKLTEIEKMAPGEPRTAALRALLAQSAAVLGI